MKISTADTTKFAHYDFRVSIFFPNLGILFLGANLGILPILKAVKRPEEHVMERPEHYTSFDAWQQNINQNMQCIQAEFRHKLNAKTGDFVPNNRKSGQHAIQG
jgi:hypothetical protein